MVMANLPYTLPVDQTRLDPTRPEPKAEIWLANLVNMVKFQLSVRQAFTAVGRNRAYTRTQLPGNW